MVSNLIGALIAIVVIGATIIATAAASLYMERRTCYTVAQRYDVPYRIHPMLGCALYYEGKWYLFPQDYGFRG